MIRFPVFAVLGPLTGYFVFTGLAGGFKGGDHVVPGFVLFLPVAWIVGLVPALITAAFDALFAWLGARSLQRYVLTGIVGYASTYLLVLGAYLEPQPLYSFGYDWGLIGGIPALLCSFVTGKLEIPVGGPALRR